MEKQRERKFSKWYQLTTTSKSTNKHKHRGKVFYTSIGLKR